jgi:putative SOS response-associated peptidase YedK
MPAVIEPADYARWLDVENVEPLAAASLLKPASEDFFIAEPTRIERAAPRPRAETPAAQMKLI